MDKLLFDGGTWLNGEDTVFFEEFGTLDLVREPEITDLANLLVTMGAKTDGISTDQLVVCGVSKLHGACHTIIPDCIEVGMLPCAVATKAVTLCHADDS